MGDACLRFCTISIVLTPTEMQSRWMTKLIKSHQPTHCWGGEVLFLKEDTHKEICISRVPFMRGVKAQWRWTVHVKKAHSLPELHTIQRVLLQWH